MKSVMLMAVLFLTATVFHLDAFAQGGDVTLKGQVVCSDCWFEQEDRKTSPYGTDADLKCAARCSKADIPQALAVWEGDKATLYLLEKGALKIEGKDFLPYAGKEVEVAGAVRTEGDKKFLKVNTLKVLSEGPATAAPVAALGTPAPAVSLSDLTGQAQSLAAHKGKIIVLNFWATWCVPCRKEMPAFVNIQNEYAAWGVQVIGASADTDETRAQVLKFVRDQKLNFPIWTGATKDQMLALGLGEELPGTAIIDRDGNVVARFKGMIKEADLKREIDNLLKQHSAQSYEQESVSAKRKSSVPA